MHAEDLFINNSSDRKAVEAICEGLPELDVVATLALVIEAVDSVDGGTLVVASQEEEVLRVLNLVCQEEADGLEGLLAAVHVVTKEEIVGVGWEATILEES